MMFPRFPVLRFPVPRFQRPPSVLCRDLEVRRRLTVLYTVLTSEAAKWQNNEKK